MQAKALLYKKGEPPILDELWRLLSSQAISLEFFLSLPQHDVLSV